MNQRTSSPVGMIMESYCGIDWDNADFVKTRPQNITPNTAKVPSYPRFSYSKLTQLQVNGAKDRAQRQLEKSEWENKLRDIKTKWNQAITKLKQHQQHDHHHHPQSDLVMFDDAVRTILLDDQDTANTFPSRQATDLSSIVLSRLAALLQKQYQLHQLEKTLGGLHDEQREQINWYYQQLQKAENEKYDMIQKEHLRLKAIQLEIQNNRLAYIEKCQSIIQQQKQILLQLHERKMENIREREIKEHMIIKRPTVCKDKLNGKSSNKQANIISPSTKWLGEMLNEDHFLSGSVLSATTTASSSSSSTDFKEGFTAESPSTVDDSNSEWVIFGY